MKRERWIKFIADSMGVTGSKRRAHVEQQLKQCWDYATCLQARKHPMHSETGAAIFGGIVGAFAASYTGDYFFPQNKVAEKLFRHVLIPIASAAGASFFSSQANKQETARYEKINNDEKLSAELSRPAMKGEIVISRYQGSIDVISPFLRAFEYHLNRAASLAEKSKILDTYSSFAIHSEMDRSMLGASVTAIGMFALSATKMQATSLAVGASVVTPTAFFISQQVIFDNLCNKLPKLPVVPEASDTAAADQKKDSLGVRRRK